jgi:hypothetical protein
MLRLPDWSGLSANFLTRATKHRNQDIMPRFSKHASAGGSLDAIIPILRKSDLIRIICPSMLLNGVHPARGGRPSPMLVSLARPCSDPRKERQYEIHAVTLDVAQLT